MATINPSASVLNTLRSRQNWAGLLLELAEHLAPGDRALIRGIYHHGMTASGFARAVGGHPRTVALRVRRLIDRMTSPTFQRILAEHRDWPEPRRSIAAAIFLQGLTQRGAASKLNVSLHRVRRESDRIRAVIETAQGPPQLNAARHSRNQEEPQLNAGPRP